LWVTVDDTQQANWAITIVGWDSSESWGGGGWGQE